MTLDTLATIASILASIAVVFTLVFIALQMRQTIQLTRMQAAQTAALLLSQNYGRVIEHGDLAELLARVDKGEDVEGAEYLRLSNFLSASFRYYEMLHTHRRHNIFEAELWAGTEARLREALDEPRMRTWWAESRAFYSKSFAALVDEICADEAEKDLMPDPVITGPANP